MIVDLIMVAHVSDIYLEAFVNATEDESRVREAVKNILGEEFDLNRQTIEGTFGNPITVLRLRISKKKDVERVLTHIARSQYFARSVERIEDRMEPNGLYHVRIDKASAYRGDPLLWEQGESIEVRFKVTSYPFSYQLALEFIKALGTSGGER